MLITGDSPIIDNPHGGYRKSAKVHYDLPSLAAQLEKAGLTWGNYGGCAFEFWERRVESSGSLTVHGDRADNRLGIQTGLEAAEGVRPLLRLRHGLNACEGVLVARHPQPGEEPAMCFRRKAFVTTVAALALIAAPAALAARVTPTSIDDQFGGQQLDSAVWFAGGSESDIALSQDRGRVTIAVPGSALPSFFAGFSTKCTAHGDFDARARFALADWPVGDALWVNLGATSLGGVNTYRTNAFGSEEYGSFIPPAGGTLVPASGDNGTLRLTRQGSTITSFYLDNGKWVTIFSGASSTADTVFTLGIFNLSGIAAFGGMPATVSFASFSLDADAVGC